MLLSENLYTNASWAQEFLDITTIKNHREYPPRGLGGVVVGAVGLEDAALLEGVEVAEKFGGRHADEVVKLMVEVA